MYFNSQGAFKTGSDPSLSQSLRVRGATFHSPRPLWGLMEDPHKNKEKAPPNAQVGRSQGSVTVIEKIILTLVEMRRKVLFRTII